MGHTKAKQFDFVVIGGGIVGLATAWTIAKRYTDARIAVLEKEPRLAAHQSGRNSGVLHSGIYYKPGSLKATTCRQGKKAMEAFCEEHQVPYELCGKVIVAVDAAETGRLQAILVRGQENGVRCSLIDEKHLHELEPHVNGVQAIHVPEAGIVDYPAVCRKLAEQLELNGHRVMLNQRVQRIDADEREVRLRTKSDLITGRFLVSCGGLYSDQLVRQSGLTAPAKIVPFRGEYYELKPGRRELCRNLIYPVPDPSFPFLGVHFTRMVSSDVECGPNAVFALAREGYNWGTIRPGELWDALTFRGFQTLARQHWQMGLGEVHRSLFKSAFVKALQRLIPAVAKDDLIPCRAGVRAQALSKDGALVDDFLWVTGPSMLHVCNAPSPAATASLEIANRIAAQVEQTLA